MLSNISELFVQLSASPIEFERAVRSDIAIVEESLLGDMARHAGIFLKWAHLSAMAEISFKRVENEVKYVRWKESKDRVRLRFNIDEIKLTNVRLDEEAAADPEYQRHKQAVYAAEEIMLYFKKVESAMWQRKDMLQSVNSRQRVELDALPSDMVGRQEAVREMLRSRRPEHAS